MALVDQESLFTPFKPKKYQSGDPSKGLIQGYQSSTLTAPRTPSSYANPEARVVNEAADGGLPAPATPSYSPPSNFDPDYQALLNYANTQGYSLPTDAQQFDQNYMVQQLKQFGIWNKLDLFYVFATDGDEDFATLNWKAPSTFKLIPTNSPTFTSNIGFTGNGTDQYLDSEWAATSGSNFTANNASHGVFTNSHRGGNATGNIGYHGQGGSGTYNFISYQLSNFTNYSQLNGLSDSTQQNNFTSFRAVTFNSSLFKVWQGFKAFVTSKSGGNISDDPMRIMQRSVSGTEYYAPSSVEFKADFWGSSLSDYEITNIITTVTGYIGKLS